MHGPLSTGRRQPQARREPQRHGTRAQHHSLAQGVLRRPRYQTVRLLGSADKELREGEVLLEVRKCVARSSRNCRDVRVLHETVEVGREVAGGGRPRDLLRAQEHPVLNGLPLMGEGGILGPRLLCLDVPVVKKAKVGARNPTQQP